MNLTEQATQSQEQSYRKIPLTQDQFAIVDETDYVWLSQWKWYARWSRDTQSFYAQRMAPKKSHIILMHREILGLNRGDSRRADHIHSGETLDNRRNNLRIATASQNSMNAKTRSDSSSGLRGVTLSRGRWQARITVSGKRYNLGFFSTAQAAYRAYCKAAPQYHGEFARLR